MKPLLVTADLTGSALEVLASELDYEIIDRRGAALSVALADGAARGAVGWVLEAEPCGDRELAALPGLRLLACVRGGPVNVDLGAASRRGIPVVYTPGRNAESVADFVIGQIIALVRQIGHTHHLLRTRALTEIRETRVRAREDIIWRPADPAAPIPYRSYRGRELRTLTLGLLGFGRVAERVATKARALEMRVIAHDPFVAPEAAGGVELVERDDLLARSDVVSLHARGSEVLVGRAELDLMRPGAYLINTARAAILDHSALIAALREGRLAGAALDVFPDEPLTPDDPLLDLDSVLLTPHIAGASLNVIDHYSHSLVTSLRALHGRGDMRDAVIANPEALADWRP